MDAFPAFVPLTGARVVLAGDGPAIEAKARLLEGSPADRVRVRGPEALKPDAYAGARLAFVAGEEPWLSAAANAARAAGAWVNAVDRPELCDFSTPAIVDRGAVVGAVGTTGAAPVLAVRLRQEIEARWPAGLGRLAELLARIRPEVRRHDDDWAARRRRLRALLHGPWAEAALAGDLDGAEALARRALHEDGLGGRAGALVLIAAPPSPDLLTLRALRMLGEADRVVLAGEPARETVELARRDAPQVAWDGGTDALLAWRDDGEAVAVLGEVATVGAALDAAGVDYVRI